MPSIGHPARNAARVGVTISIHHPLSTDLSKISGCRAAVLPSSGYRDTKPPVTSVLIRAPLSVTPVTCARGTRLALRCDAEHTIPVIEERSPGSRIARDPEHPTIEAELAARKARKGGEKRKLGRAQ